MSYHCTFQRYHWPGLSNADPLNNTQQVVEIIHLFHPLFGRKFKLVEIRQTWGEERVYYYDENDNLASIPLNWTNLQIEPFKIISAGRAHFCTKDLLEISKLIRELL